MLCLAYCSSCLSVLVKACVADVRHTDWHQGPFSRGLVPSQAQLDEMCAKQPGLSSSQKCGCLQPKLQQAPAWETQKLSQGVKSARLQWAAQI